MDIYRVIHENILSILLVDCIGHYNSICSSYEHVSNSKW